jgi:hypothetical protein
MKDETNPGHRLPPVVFRNRELRSTARVRKEAASATIKSIDQAEIDRWINEEWPKIFGEETALENGAGKLRRPAIRRRGCSVPSCRNTRMVHKSTQTEEMDDSSSGLEPVSPTPLDAQDGAHRTHPPPIWSLPGWGLPMGPLPLFFNQ